MNSGEAYPVTRTVDASIHQFKDKVGAAAVEVSDKGEVVTVSTIVWRAGRVTPAAGELFGMWFGLWLLLQQLIQNNPILYAKDNAGSWEIFM